MNTENTEKQGGRVVLAPVLDPRAAAPLAEELLALRGADLVVDASQVEKVGAQCVQALLSAVKTWAVDGNTIAIFDESPAFSEATAHLGVCLSKTEMNESEPCH